MRHRLLQTTSAHQILIESSDMQGYLQSLVRDQDEPIADWVCIPLYFVKLTIDNGVKVVLVGEGADEQFCGYDGYMRYPHFTAQVLEALPGYVPESVSKGRRRGGCQNSDITPQTGGVCRYSG